MQSEGNVVLTYDSAANGFERQLLYPESSHNLDALLPFIRADTEQAANRTEHPLDAPSV